MRILTCLLLCSVVAIAQGPPNQQNADPAVREARPLISQGKMDEALAVYEKALKENPDSAAVNNAAGSLLDLMGRGEVARKYFAKVAETAATPQAKANANRQIAMSYAFEGNCKKTGEYEQKVIDYWTTVPDYYQQGEMANEAARVCIESGDLDAAEKWYKTGHDLGVKEPNISPARKELWEFREEHALGRLAARRGNKAEAMKHVAAAKAILDKGVIDVQQQSIFYPYLVGYVALYTGDYKTALDELQKANQNDPFIQCLIGQTYEKLGDKEKASEYFKKAAGTTGHNPPAAYARWFTRKKMG